MFEKYNLNFSYLLDIRRYLSTGNMISSIFSLSGEAPPMRSADAQQIRTLSRFFVSFQAYQEAVWFHRNFTKITVYAYLKVPEVSPW